MEHYESPGSMLITSAEKQKSSNFKNSYGCDFYYFSKDIANVQKQNVLKLFMWTYNFCPILLLLLICEFFHCLKYLDGTTDFLNGPHQTEPS